MRAACSMLKQFLRRLPNGTLGTRQNILVNFTTIGEVDVAETGCVDASCTPRQGFSQVLQLPQTGLNAVVIQIHIRPQSIMKTFCIHTQYNPSTEQTIIE